MTKDLVHIKKIVYTLCFVLVSIAVINCSSRITDKETTKLINNQPKTNSPSVNQISNQNENNIEIPKVDSSQIRTVTYCGLIDNAFDHDHKIVRVRAIYGNEFERSFLFDSNCKQDLPPVAPKLVPAETWTQWDKSFVSTGDSDEAKLNQKIKGFGRKDVTLIGRFFSTNEAGDNNAPNLFGHDNCCHYQFLIMRVEKVHSIIEKPGVSSNKFGGRIKYEVNQKLEFAEFTLECLQLSKTKNTFKVVENDNTTLLSADNEMPTKFTINGIKYKLELGVADKSGRIASDELIVSKINK